MKVGGAGAHRAEEQADGATSSFRKEVEVTDAKACRISKRKMLFQRDEQCRVITADLNSERASDFGNDGVTGAFGTSSFKAGGEHTARVKNE